MVVARFSIKVRGSFAVFFILAASILWGSAAYAQVAGATLTGTVTDPSGAVIPRAQVLINDVATAVTRNIVTDNSGFYSAPNLLPGTYEVTVTAPGFGTQVRAGVT